MSIVPLPAVQAASSVLYVKASAPAGGNGSSWATAYQSIQTAVNAASSGSQVWVAAGSYAPAAVNSVNILMKDGVSLYGGFAGTETSLSQRNWTTNLTILQGTSDATLMRIPGAAAIPMVISGFEMTGTVAIDIAGASTSLTISNNVFEALEDIENIGGTQLIQFNTFKLSQTSAQAMTLTGAPQILDNIVVIVSGTKNTSGIAVVNNSSSLQAVIASNLVVGVGTAISAASASPLIANNTVVGATVDGVLIDGSGSTPTIANNIIAFNPGVGIANQNSPAEAAVEEYNLVYGNGTNYSGLSAGSHDILQNPLFVNQTSNYQLTSTSPALTTADGGLIQAGWVDLNGSPLTPGSDPAMGAYQVAAKATSVSVPNVVGDTQAAATTAITGAGLVLGTVTKQSSSSVASGNVISESPVAATSVSTGSAVNLVVSSGPATIAVPNVVGDTQAAATTAITGAGLVLGTVTKQSSSSVASGNVISESPVAATTVSTGSAVNLVVSSGPATIAVPNVVGDTQAAATTAITGAGLVLGTVTKQSSSTVASGNVISESPVAGTSVSTGSAVTLVVSSGPAVTTKAVPNVVGDTQAAATTAITSAGLVLGTVTTASSSTVPSGDVISESPVAGTSVAAGSAVSLVVSSSSSAKYTGTNTATQGAWTGKYGANGAVIDGAEFNPPAYATVSLTGEHLYTWAASTTDPRALQVSSGSSNRIASIFYSPTSFTINVNLKDGNMHQIALYLLDWDKQSLAETISILDAVSMKVLDTETYSSFSQGEYAVWNVQGNVVIQVTKTGGADADVSGIFFDPVP